jgi:hypothetical protein
MVLTGLPSGSGASGKRIILRVSGDRVVLDPGWVDAVVPVHGGLTVGATAIALFRVVGMTLSLGPGLKMTRPSIGLIRAVVVSRPVVVPGPVVVSRPVIGPRTPVIPRAPVIPRTPVIPQPVLVPWPLVIPRTLVVPQTLMVPWPAVVPRTLVIPWTLALVAPRPVVVPRLQRVVARCVIVIEPGSLVASLGVLHMPITGAVGKGPTQVSERRASMRRSHIPQQFRGNAFASSNVQVRKSFGIN